MDPTEVKARNNLGKAYQEMGLLDEAIKQYQAALQLYTLITMGLINLVKVYEM